MQQDNKDEEYAEKFRESVKVKTAELTDKIMATVSEAKRSNRLSLMYALCAIAAEYLENTSTTPLVTAIAFAIKWIALFATIATMLSHEKSVGVLHGITIAEENFSEMLNVVSEQASEVIITGTPVQQEEEGIK